MGSGLFWAYDGPRWGPGLGGTGDEWGNYKYREFDATPLTELIGCVGEPLPSAWLCSGGALPPHCVRQHLGRWFPSASALFGANEFIDLSICNRSTAEGYLRAFSPPVSSVCGARSGGINVEG
jgi:hypothetical protein